MNYFYRKYFYGDETISYNRAMKRILTAYGIQIEEIERRAEGEIPVSASAVRKCLEKVVQLKS
ncbi:hypothetical protein LJC58_09020 [Lachnospiraceae bacterium OttesenSCG-928-D06]|nr:hypothetical protein [Lachnospiraceae bacterium OttesenSCG-928-D06]